MPELPEVQTIVNDLNRKIVGEQIVDFWSDWKKNVRPSFSKFSKEVNEAKIVCTRRIGKHIIIDLNNKKSITIHLKMSGHLLFKKDRSRTPVPREFTEKVNQYIHHIFNFKSGATLEFSDLRKFGWLSVVKTSDVEGVKEIKKLGVDALSPDFNLEKFKEILNSKNSRRRTSTIGVLLLDQSLIAGIGNIYRSEILFSAGVNPKRKVSSLKDGEINKIYKYTKNILKEAVRMRGTSDADYRDTEGKQGGFQNLLKVYRREGEKCFGCKGLVKREKLAQRSIFFCTKCQK